jgi:hypothetical protein
MKQTAMQELRNDLVEAKEIIRNYCQEAVKLTIESIIKRIDDELLEMEKQQIIDAHGSKLKKSRGTTNYEYWYTGEQIKCYCGHTSYCDCVPQEETKQQ